MKKSQVKILEWGIKKTLTREELKNIKGADGASRYCLTGACSLTIQGDNGVFITRNGTCDSVFNMGGSSPYTCYCNAGLGVVPVTTNHNTSKCTSTTNGGIT